VVYSIAMEDFEEHGRAEKAGRQNVAERKR
jgi:hypothetical protein